MQERQEFTTSKVVKSEFVTQGSCLLEWQRVCYGFTRNDFFSPFFVSYLFIFFYECGSVSSSYFMTNGKTRRLRRRQRGSSKSCFACSCNFVSRNEFQKFLRKLCVDHICNGNCNTRQN